METRFLGKLSVFSLSLLTFGCQYNSDVTVTGSANNLTIDVKIPSVSNIQRGIGVASLSTNMGGKEQSVWQVDAKDGCAEGVTRLIYGKTPPGFTSHTSPKALLNGVDYVAEVFGCGYSGKAYFHLVRGQAVTIDRPPYDR